MASDLPVYQPPTGDGPLDAIEQALVRALVPILVRKIRDAAATCHGEPVAEKPHILEITDQAEPVKGSSPCPTT